MNDKKYLPGDLKPIDPKLMERVKLGLMQCGFTDFEAGAFGPFTIRERVGVMGSQVLHMDFKLSTEMALNGDDVISAIDYYIHFGHRAGMQFIEKIASVLPCIRIGGKVIMLEKDYEEMRRKVAYSPGEFKKL